MAEAAARAELGLQAVMERLDALPTGTGSDLQRVDLVRQSLEDLARLLWVAAEAASPPTDHAVERPRIKDAAVLASLSERLLRSQGIDRATSEMPQTDLDLF